MLSPFGKSLSPELAAYLNYLYAAPAKRWVAAEEDKKRRLAERDKPPFDLDAVCAAANTRLEQTIAGMAYRKLSEHFAEFPKKQFFQHPNGTLDYYDTWNSLTLSRQGALDSMEYAFMKSDGSRLIINDLVSKNDIDRELESIRKQLDESVWVKLKRFLINLVR